MAEEEIVLRVRLEDLATPQLRQIQREIALIGAGPGNLPKLRRELTERRRRPMSEVGGRTDSTRTCRHGRV
jgi:hypothetical protein